ncbi:hypothetical protein V8N76_004578 [Salmonella enterica]
MEIRAREHARRYAASNLTSLSADSISEAEDLRGLLEDNHYEGPEVIYYHEAWDIINDNDAPEPDEAPDFSGCESAKACCMLEAQMIMDAAYREALDEILGNLQDAIDEIEGESDLGDLEGITLGGAGLDSQPHDEERDIANGGNLCIWRKYHRAELSIDGIKLTFEYSEDDDDNEDDA